MAAAARRQVFQTKESPNPVLQMNDKVAFFQFGEINVEGGAGGQRVRGFQPARPLNFIAPKNFRVGDDNEFCCFAQEPAGKRANSRLGSGVRVLGLRGARVFLQIRDARSKTQLLPNFREPLPLAVVVAEDVNGMVLAEPAVKLVEEFAALRLGDLWIRRMFAERAKGVERIEPGSAEFRFGVLEFKLQLAWGTS